MFSKEIYISRRAALMEAMKGEKGVAVFVGNTDSPAQYRDNCYKFRQDSTWLYLFGLQEPGWAAVLDFESGAQTLYADDCDIDDIIWNGPTPSVAERAASVGIESTRPSKALAADVKGRKIHFVPCTRLYNAGIIAELAGLGSPAQTFSQGKKGCPEASAKLVRALIEMRIVKGPEEIEILDYACALGQQMHTIARRGIREGRIEQEIVGEMEGFALAKGWGVSFPTILTQHGEVFHCHSHECPVQPGRLMVIDAGLEVNEGYASDFTRTYPTSGRFTPKQKDIYDIVCACHDYAFEHTKPGVAYLSVHLGVERLLLERLAALGLVQGSVDDMLAEGTAGLFLPHGLGHNMGLDVHDMEDYGEDLVGYGPGQSRSSLLGRGSLRMARELRPGNVVTDEPGIYFIPDLIRLWKKENKPFVNYGKLEEYYDFGGIRLEDDVLVTPDGARRLGAERLPASSADIEEAMKWDSLKEK